MKNHTTVELCYSVVVDPSHDDKAIAEATILAQARDFLNAGYALKKPFTIRIRIGDTAQESHSDQKKEQFHAIQLQAIEELIKSNPSFNQKDFAQAIGISGPQITRLFRVKIRPTKRTLSLIETAVARGNIQCPPETLEALKKITI